MPDLGPRGSALWNQLEQDEFSPSGVLAVEACRLADRLEQLNDVIAGKGVLQLMHFRSMFDDDDERHLTMTVDHVLTEARMQQATLKALLESSALRKSESKGASPIDALAARRADRRSATSSS